MAQVDAELECSDPETDPAKLGFQKVLDGATLSSDNLKVYVDYREEAN